MAKPSWVHGYTRKMWRWGRIFIPVWIAGVGIFVGAAAIDATWHLGWGYHWRDALMGLGMIAFGALFWIAWNWSFKVISRVNETFYGPDQSG